jgi:intracellular sulfur oxidation DsrE/DsrF family protein
MKKPLLLLAALFTLLACFSPAALAQQPAPAVVSPATGVVAPKTNKTHHIVFALTSGEEADWNLTMGNLTHLVAGLKPDPYEIEVVTYGPGIMMVKGDSTVAKEIAALQEQGVRFVACQNAMRAHHLELKDLLAGVTPVPAGIVEVVTKQEQGWVYIHAGR